jgi:hypothetical protein
MQIRQFKSSSPTKLFRKDRFINSNVIETQTSHAAPRESENIVTVNSSCDKFQNFRYETEFKHRANGDSVQFLC